VIIKKILQKSYENLRRNYAKLTTTLQVSYENVKFAASDSGNPLLEVVFGRVL